jgi:chloramphenicol O-acetyltransferase type A
MQKIDLAVWPRAELFRFFSTVSNPFYSVTFRVDVTNLHAYTKAHGISFYYALGYLVTDAVNSVVNFRYTIRDGEVWLLDKRIPSFTDLKPDSEQFHIVTLPKIGTLDEFCCAAKAKSAAQQSFLDQSGELDDLIYFSCVPWFDLTAATNERDFDRDDNIPRICWGKYVPADGRETLGMSVEVNHRFIDGYHLGQFYQKLQKSIDEL